MAIVLRLKSGCSRRQRSPRLPNFRGQTVQEPLDRYTCEDHSKGRTPLAAGATTFNELRSRPGTFVASASPHETDKGALRPPGPTSGCSSCTRSREKTKPDDFSSGFLFPGRFGPSRTFLEYVLVPGGGLEPPRPCDRWILSPLRLPIPPSRPEFEFIFDLINPCQYKIDFCRANTRCPPAPREQTTPRSADNAIQNPGLVRRETESTP